MTLLESALLVLAFVGAVIAGAVIVASLRELYDWRVARDERADPRADDTVDLAAFRQRVARARRRDPGAA